MPLLPFLQIPQPRAVWAASPGVAGAGDSSAAAFPNGAPRGHVRCSISVVDPHRKFTSLAYFPAVVDAWHGAPHRFQFYFKSLCCPNNSFNLSFTSPNSSQFLLFIILLFGVMILCPSCVCRRQDRLRTMRKCLLLQHPAAHTPSQSSCPAMLQSMARTLPCLCMVRRNGNVTNATMARVSK